MIVLDGVCNVLDNLWGAVGDAGLCDIPVIGNVIAAVIDVFWGLFGCDFW